METLFPKITLEGTADGRLAVTIVTGSDDGERLAFTALIASTPRHLPARSVAEIGLAACEIARQMLDGLRQSYVDAAAA